MKYEIIFFRLLLLTIFSSVVMSGSYALYAYTQSKEWQVFVSNSYEKLNKADIACEKDRSSFTCEMGKTWQERFDSSVENRDYFIGRAETFAHLTYLIPLVSIYLFYSFRWVITGKIRPLIIKLKRTTNS